MYTIRQVSAMLGIPSVTLRAWENRYGAVQPQRTETGYRTYSIEDVNDLRWLKEQVETHDAPISQAVKQLKSRKQQSESLHPAMEHMAQDSYSDLAERIYQVLLRFDAAQGHSMIDMGFTMHGYDAMFYRVLSTILIRVGDDWEQGKATVAQEHFITQLISQRFYQFFYLFPVNTRYPKALAICPEGEHHQVGLLQFALFLRKKGVDVLYLGANTPLDGLRALISDQHVELICMSVTGAERVVQADQMVQQLHKQHPSLDFILGGKGYEQATAPRYPQWIVKQHPDDWQEWFGTKFSDI
ncbi:MerR family transcriptional regulator [Paenibacillus sp. FSL K6-1230]|uniref:MerR family transcriptional regulator n=1 Tax=Paenibacillus sp. FSL K6-1230 TaxID=2921603 RepID=UPI0003AAF054